MTTFLGTGNLNSHIDTETGCVSGSDQVAYQSCRQAYFLKQQNQQQRTNGTTTSNAFYTAPTTDELATSYSNYPSLPSQQQEVAITQLCGEVYPTHYHYNPLNIILAIVVVVSGVILIKRNSAVIAKHIKDNSLKTILILAVAILILSLTSSVFIEKSKIKKFEADTIKSFFYTTSDRISENEVTKYVECRIKYLNSTHAKL